MDKQTIHWLNHAAIAVQIQRSDRGGSERVRTNKRVIHLEGLKPRSQLLLLQHGNQVYCLDEGGYVL